MRRRVILGVLGLGVGVLQANNLESVYRDALTDSPLLKQYKATNQASAEAVPISVAAVLPQIALTANATATHVSGPGFNSSYPSEAYNIALTQTLFNYNQFAGIAYAHDTKIAAEANYQSQLQSFILLVAEDYFAVLLARDTLTFSQAEVDSLKMTLAQTQLQFKVGVSTYTDVQQAQANYDTAVAAVLQNENALDNANQALFALTGKNETNLAGLGANFPFLPPTPNNPEVWIAKALKQNAALISEEASSKAALAAVNQAVGNELPVVSAALGYNAQYYRSNVPATISLYTHVVDKTAAFNLTWTLFEGGALVADSLQAANQYAAAEDTALNLYRQTQSNTAQDFSSVLSSLAQINAYKLALQSAQSTLNSDLAKFKVGTATIVDVLNATQVLYQAKTNLANSEYQYINSYLQLQYDAGSLNPNTLAQLNQYLGVVASPAKAVPVVKAAAVKAAPVKKQHVKHQKHTKAVATSKARLHKKTHAVRRPVIA